MATQGSRGIAAQVWCTDKNKRTDMDVDLAEEFATILDKYVEALHFCSGSADFGPGGQAHKGWNKLCRPLLDGHAELDS